MRVFLGSDHAGFAMKEALKPYLERRGDEVTDVGADTEDSADYPDFAEQVARAVSEGRADRGVLICGSGIGMAIAANKVSGVRAAMVTDAELAKMMRLHNDANVVTLGGRYISQQLAEEILDAFFDTEFEGGRHQARVDKIAALERHE
ncbi:MAG: ribose 5-phosphate isomerase B [Actinomycetota bacterium]|nr:ribose 5-phosphate isomerase B [Actinomycetota bacterium]